MDISAEKMIFGVAGIDPQRRDELIKVSRKMKSAIAWSDLPLIFVAFKRVKYDNPRMKLLACYIKCMHVILNLSVLC